MTKKLFRVAAAVCLSSKLLCTAPSAHADETEPLISDRPDFTESNETVAKGTLQIEGGLTRQRGGDERSDSFGEVLIRRGIGAKTELRFEAPTYAVGHGSGGRTSDFEDGAIGFKTVLSKGAEGYGFKHPRISLLGLTSLPIGSRDVRGSGVQPTVKLLLGVDLSERVSLSSNLNASYLKDDDGHYSEFAASVSMGVGITDKVGSFFEVYGFLPSGSRDSLKYFDTGLTYLLSNDLQVDARVGFGLNNHLGGPDYFYGVGVARRF